MRAYTIEEKKNRKLLVFSPSSWLLCCWLFCFFFSFACYFFISVIALNCARMDRFMTLSSSRDNKGCRKQWILANKRYWMKRKANGKVARTQMTISRKAKVSDRYCVCVPLSDSISAMRTTTQWMCARLFTRSVRIYYVYLCLRSSKYLCEHSKLEKGWSDGFVVATLRELRYE